MSNERNSASSVSLASISSYPAIEKLVRRAMIEGQAWGDEVRQAIEADGIPSREWKNTLRQLQKIFDREGVTLSLGSPKKPAEITSPSALETHRSPAQEGSNELLRRSAISEEVIYLSRNPDAPAASTALLAGLERIFQRVGPPPDELLDEYRDTSEGGDRR
ncbi:hypothetical protein ACFVUW_11800 [Streptomyces xiamenensis]|uniref:hypothetical protein n=1 Tax=Streptomyces xiamenensis TaxID=408015 RepID=UPI0036ED4396